MIQFIDDLSGLLTYRIHHNITAIVMVLVNVLASFINLKLVLMSYIAVFMPKIETLQYIEVVMGIVVFCVQAAAGTLVFYVVFIRNFKRNKAKQ